MAGDPSISVPRELCSLFRVGAVGGMPDGELLEWFLSQREEAAEAAFEELVTRHGPMVFRVCRSILQNEHDAEDAFQAAFLVLANRAATVRRKDGLASWLYGVAQRVAHRLKRTAARGRAADRRAGERAVDRVGPPAIESDGVILHEEIGALPERLRAPVVLCYLEEKTYEAAADELGLSSAAVRGRLARARDRLRRRLVGRGVAVPAGLAAAGLAAPSRGALSATLVRTTVRIALGLTFDSAAGVLARGVLRSAVVSQLRVAAIVVWLVVGSSYAAWRVLASPVDEPGGKRHDSAIARGAEAGPSARAQEPPRAWFILAQTDTNGLLHGLPQRLSRAVERSPRRGPMWDGGDGGGRLELEIHVRGDAAGEIVVGFFADPRWNLAEPVQVRRFPRPGRYTIDRLMPGKFQLGAMVGALPGPRALGMHGDWPKPVEIRAGERAQARLLLSTQFQNQPAGQFGLDKGFAGQWDRMDPARKITIRTVDAQGAPVPFCRITLADREGEKTGFYRDIGTDDQGVGYYDKFARTFSIMAQRFEIMPERMGSRWHSRTISELYDARDRPVITVTWPPFPTGPGKVTGRVHDQHGRPLTQYYLGLTSSVGEVQGWRDVDHFGIHVPITDPGGRFEVGDLPPGDYTALIRHFDYPTHVFRFDGPRITVPDGPDAPVDVDLEVEAKELSYGRALYEDGAPVHPGTWIAWFEKYDQQQIMKYGGQPGRTFSLRLEPDGSFRVALSREERADLMKTTGGRIEIRTSQAPLGEVSVDRLSRDPERPFEFRVARPRSTKGPGTQPQSP
jgi:RNA polymerase sigma factor (sigma-70 family)